MFSNVSKGTLAKHEDLVDVFGTDNEDKICRLILADGDLQVHLQLEWDRLPDDASSACLAKHRGYSMSQSATCVHLIHFPTSYFGLLQVSDKERQLELDSLFKDVASVLSEKCINPDNNKPYTITMLERALKDVHFSVDLHRNAKQQALDVSHCFAGHAFCLSTVHVF